MLPDFSGRGEPKGTQLADLMGIWYDPTNKDAGWTDKKVIRLLLQNLVLLWFLIYDWGLSTTDKRWRGGHKKSGCMGVFHFDRLEPTTSLPSWWILAETCLGLPRRLQQHVQAQAAHRATWLWVTVSGVGWKCCILMHFEASWINHEFMVSRIIRSWLINL